MIGIIGGYGAVGAWATRYIKAHTAHKLRIGGRSVEKAPAGLRTEWNDDEWIKVDVSDKESVMRFMDGCEILLDCAKLTQAQSAMMDEIAENEGIPVLHLGIEGFQRRESKIPVLYGAGSLPGLSGLIPQYLAQKFDSVSSLELYYCGLGTISYIAAKDYMDSLSDSGNHSMVYWKDGRLIPYVPASSDIETDLNRINPYNKVFPFFDAEAQAVTRKLNIKESRFHMCICGKHTIETVNSARYQYKQNPEETIRKICNASVLDVFGIKENIFIWCIMDGIKDFAPQKLKMTVSGLVPSQMTGVAAGAATVALAEGARPYGIQLLGESDLGTAIINSLILNQPGFACEVKNLSLDEIEGEI